MFGNACGLGDFARRRAAVILAGEQVAGGREQKLAGGAAGPTRGLGRRLSVGLLFGGRSLGHGCTLLNRVRWLTVYKIVVTILRSSSYRERYGRGRCDHVGHAVRTDRSG